MKQPVNHSALQSELSVQRTILANHRTLLSYLRSAVGLIVAGAGLLKFVHTPVWIVIGIICVVLAPVVLILGIIDFLRVRRLIKKELDILSSSDCLSNCSSVSLSNSDS